MLFFTLRMVPLLRRVFLLAALATSIGGLLGAAQAQNVLPVPPLSSRVIDSTRTLSDAERTALEAKLAAFEQSTGAQVVVLMLPSTAPEDISSFANRVASTWKIGRKDVGDGLLLIIAKDERKLRIEVSRALEGAVPDLAAKRVMDQAITPRFKQGDFAGGLDAGVEAIMALIRNEGLPAPAADAPQARKKNAADWTDLLVFALFAFPIASTIAKRALGNKLGSLLVGGAVGAIVLQLTATMLVAAGAGLVGALLSLLLRLPADSNRYRPGRFGGWGPGGGWGGSSGSIGGGFGSGGGGGFGGGGASGGW